MNFSYELLEVRASGRDHRARRVSRALSAMRPAAARLPELRLLRSRLQQSVPRDDGGACGRQGSLELLRILRARRRSCRPAARVDAGAGSAVTGSATRARSSTRFQEEKTMTIGHPGAMILAAGLGTRMRSERAKVLHELGGEPMIARVMRAVATLEPTPLVRRRRPSGARGRGGRARAAVPGRERRAFRAASRAARHGPRSAMRPGRLSRRISRRRPHRLWRHADDPAGDARGVHRASIARAGAALSFISAKLDDPGAYGRVVRDSRGSGRGDRRGARRDRPQQLAIREINTGVYLVAAAVSARGARRAAPQQCAGRILPDRHRRDRARSAGCASWHGARPTRPSSPESIHGRSWH